MFIQKLLVHKSFFSYTFWFYLIFLAFPLSFEFLLSFYNIVRIGFEDILWQLHRLFIRNYKLSIYHLDESINCGEVLNGTVKRWIVFHDLDFVFFEYFFDLLNFREIFLCFIDPFTCFFIFEHLIFQWSMPLLDFLRSMSLECWRSQRWL